MRKYRFLGAVLALIATTLTLAACSAPKQQPRQAPAVQRPAPPVVLQQVQVSTLPPAPRAASLSVQYDALMKRDGRTISIQEFVDCMDPEKRSDCKRGFPAQVNWQYYAGLMQRRFGLQLPDFEAWSKAMHSVTLVACTTDLVSKYNMGRIARATGKITEDYHRTQCYGGEAFFAYKGEAFISNVCANGLVPVVPPPATPACVGTTCARPATT